MTRFPNDGKVSKIDQLPKTSEDSPLVYRVDHLSRQGYGSIPVISVGGYEKTRNEKAVVAELVENRSLLDVWRQEIVEREGLPDNTGIRVSGDNLVMYGDGRVPVRSYERIFAFESEKDSGGGSLGRQLSLGDYSGIV